MGKIITLRSTVTNRAVTVPLIGIPMLLVNSLDIATSIIKILAEQLCQG